MPLRPRVRAALSRGLLSVLAGTLVTLAAQPLARAVEGESVASVITRLRVQEAPQPVKERAQWRAPHKVVLLAFGADRGWTGREGAFAARAPKAQVIVAKNMGEAVPATADADVIIGFNPEICLPKIVDNDKQLRW